MESLRFLTSEEALWLQGEFGTPLYVYDAATLKRQAAAMLAFPAPYGLTVRYAMKASSNAAILRLFDGMGLHFDASSGYEAERALRAGIKAEKINISTQELPCNFAELIRKGVSLNACSLSQLEAYGKAFPGSEIGVRLNPGLGSGANGKTNTGGQGSSFGIWNGYADKVREMARHYGLKIVRIHTHIGSGSDPEVWARVAELNMAMVAKFPDATTLDMGGGFKVARVAGEKSVDLVAIGARVRAALERFATETGRKLHLEVEPGTFLLANSGAVVSTVQDIVDTDVGGHTFIKLDTGMTEVLRPSLYGSQHALVVVPKTPRTGTKKYVVVGHCCESGDLLSCAPGEPETITERELTEAAIGDVCVVEGAGAYCSAMSTKNYNSFPEAPEALKLETGEFKLIRKRQTLEQLLANELG